MAPHTFSGRLTRTRFGFMSLIFFPPVLRSHGTLSPFTFLGAILQSHAYSRSCPSAITDKRLALGFVCTTKGLRTTSCFLFASTSTRAPGHISFGGLPLSGYMMVSSPSSSRHVLRPPRRCRGQEALLRATYGPSAKNDIMVLVSCLRECIALPREDFREATRFSRFLLHCEASSSNEKRAMKNVSSMRGRSTCHSRGMYIVLEAQAALARQSFGSAH